MVRFVARCRVDCANCAICFGLRHYCVNTDRLIIIVVLGVVRVKHSRLIGVPWRRAFSGHNGTLNETRFWRTDSHSGNTCFQTRRAGWPIPSFYSSETSCSVHSFVIVLIEVTVIVTGEGTRSARKSELVLNEGASLPVTSTCCPR
jgi:hypothetical protein